MASKLMPDVKEEYNRLGRHIEGQFRLIIQIFTASLVASLGVLGYIGSVIYGFQPTSNKTVYIEPFLAFAPLIIVFSCGLLIGYLRMEIFKWGAYIKVFLNDGKNWRYESELDKYRSKFHEEESLDGIAILYCFVLVLCFFVYWFGLNKSSMQLEHWLPISLIPTVLFAWWWIWYSSIPRRWSKRYEDRWRQIRNSDTENSSGQGNSKKIGNRYGLLFLVPVGIFILLLFKKLGRRP
jgi:hypothetical protein